MAVRRRLYGRAARPPPPGPPTLLPRGHAYHAKEPGLEGRPTLKTRPPIQYFQIGHLQDIFRLAPVMSTTDQGPGETLAVQCLKQFANCGWIRGSLTHQQG